MEDHATSTTNCFGFWQTPRAGASSIFSRRGSTTVSELAAEFPKLVRSGMSKHLMSLRGRISRCETPRSQQIYLINGRN